MKKWYKVLQAQKKAVLARSLAWVALLHEKKKRKKENIEVIKLYASNYIASKYKKQKLI